MNVRPSLGSPANDDMTVGNSLSFSMSIQDFAAGGTDVARAGWAQALSTDFSGISLPQRIQRHLVMAQCARCEAAGSKDAAVRQSYLFVAEQWEKLALDLALDSARRLRIDMTSTPGPKH